MHYQSSMGPVGGRAWLPDGEPANRVLLRRDPIHPRPYGRGLLEGLQMKLTVVGGGSTYTPELIDGIAGRRSTLDVDEIVLVDPDAYRVEAVGGFSQRILDHAGHPARVRTTQ